MPGSLRRLRKTGSVGCLLISLLTQESVAHSPSSARGILEIHAASFRSESSLTALKRAGIVQQRLQKRIANAPVSPFPRPRTLLPVVDHPDIHDNHKIIADEILRLLPTNCRSALKNFYVRYDHPVQRGLAGKSSIVLSGNVPDDEFRALLIHEIFGHVVDLGCLTGRPESGPSNFRDGKETIYRSDPSASFYEISWQNEQKKRSDSHNNDFVTGYASWDAFEDMAETVTYFVLQEEAFRARALENAVLNRKLQWMDANLFTGNKRMATGLHRWSGAVPWDATKLPYTWMGNGSVAQVQ